MHTGLILHIISFLLIMMGVMLGCSSLVAGFYRGFTLEVGDFAALLYSSIGWLLLGGLLNLFTRHFRHVAMNHREGFLIVGISWITIGIAGALPYYLYANYFAFDPAGQEWQTPINALFESFSGFTTTGSTVLESGLWETPAGGAGYLPHGILFWRSLTHWLGGMGIILIGVAILPLLGVGGMQLFKAEVPGISADKLSPRISETAKMLWKIYATITAIQAIVLMGCGMDFYNAVCHSFSTMGTGGFSTMAKSIESFNSPVIEWVISFFMFAAGLNFALSFHAIFKGSFFPLIKDDEARFYGVVFLLMTVIVGSILYIGHIEPTFESSFRKATFQVIAILTTTGFTTANSDAWRLAFPILGALLFMLYFVGGSCGSTGGGIKCLRVLMLFKMAYREIYRLVHPHAVVQIRHNSKVVHEDTLRPIVGFVTIYLMIFVLGTLLLTTLNYDLLSAASAAISSIGNVGPAFGAFGAYENYNHVAAGGKMALIFLMLLGRLEIYTILIVLFPIYWRK